MGLILICIWICYLGDMLDTDGGYESAVMARVRSAWKKFPEYEYL